MAERVTFEDPIVLRRPRVWTPTVERLRRPKDFHEPSGNRIREVGSSPKLVGPLLTHTEELGNVNDRPERGHRRRKGPRLLPGRH
jgi:hypothetical protein